MNDSAKTFAERIRKEAGEDSSKQIAFGLKLIFVTNPVQRGNQGGNQHA